MSLSFVVPKEQWGKDKVVGGLPSAERDEKVFSRIEKEQGARGSKIKEYNFDMKQVEAFRYRMQDALRSVTRAAIREARVKELKAEILNSDKLKVSSFLVLFLQSSDMISDSGAFRGQPARPRVPPTRQSSAPSPGTAPHEARTQIPHAEDRARRGAGIASSGWIAG
jgi:anti-sigma28 factor (negative regulator of flagellin synthesis)